MLAGDGQERVCVACLELFASHPSESCVACLELLASHASGSSCRMPPAVRVASVGKFVSHMTSWSKLWCSGGRGWGGQHKIGIARGMGACEACDTTFRRIRHKQLEACDSTFRRMRRKQLEVCDTNFPRHATRTAGGMRHEEPEACDANSSRHATQLSDASDTNSSRHATQLSDACDANSSRYTCQTYASSPRGAHKKTHSRQP